MNDAAANDSAVDPVEDASSDASYANDAAADDAGDAASLVCGSDGEDIRTGSTCAENVGGVFAVKTVLDVWWNDDIDPPIIDPGRGYITLYQKATIKDACDDGTIERVELQTCGLVLPTLVSWVNCNAYQMAVPDSVWDEPTMPTWETAGSISSFDLGGMLAFGSVDALIGIDLADDGGAWPPFVDEVICGAGSAQPDACFRDHDGDGVLGVPFSLINVGANYLATGCGLEGNQPVRFDGFRADALLADCDTDCTRVVELHAGARARHVTRAKLSSCSADGTQLVGDSAASPVDMRAIGCERNDGETCTDDEVRFVDSMLQSFEVLGADATPPLGVEANPCSCPDGCTGEGCDLDQTPSAGPRTAMVWLGDEAGAFDCADVRSAVEAAYPGVESLVDR